MPAHPEVLWAQRSSESDEKKNILYVTVNLPDIKAGTLEYNLTPTSLSFKAKAGNADKGIEEKDYEFAIDLYAEVVPEASSKNLTSRSLSLLLRKKELRAEYWPRLTKEKVRNAFIKTDFSKWVDEDEQDGDAAAVEEDFDMGGGMGGMGGMPGMGGMGGMPGMGGMGGMPGMGGMGGMDLDSMLKSMGGGAGGFDPDAAGPSGADVESDDSDDDGPPPLEGAEPKA
ncbi:HSP20-like chaperone [Daedaleopsis nitida]|nr:HSP20-like chaperone [Daedaleopsis nitida]